MNIGDTYKSFEWDISEVREIEILFIYKESYERELDIILYRYFGQNNKVWFYRVRRRFEVMSSVNYPNTAKYKDEMK